MNNFEKLCIKVSNFILGTDGVRLIDLKRDSVGVTTKRKKRGK